MQKTKRIAPGVYRRVGGEIVVIATVWGCPGKRERILPPDTELHEAVKVRKELCEGLKGALEPDRGSLTFHWYVEHYRKTAGKHAQSSIVTDIDRELGHLPVACIEEAWKVFIQRQEHRNRMVWRRVEKGLKLVDTGKPITVSTVKSYKRYFKAICRNAMSHETPKSLRLTEKLDPSAGMKIGRVEKRRRPLTPRERESIFDAAGRLYPWFVPVIQFASTMPIRPGDQCALQWSAIDELHGQIPYLPIKTAKTGTFAYPLMLPNLRNFLMGRIGDRECPYIFYSVEDDGHRVPLTYSRIASAWGIILRESGIAGLRFYDLRHDAVSFCLNAGFTTRDVMAFAGWNSAEMVDGYDTRDRIRLAERARQIIDSGLLDKYTVNVSVNAGGENRVKYGI